ncbi:hypothetical protein [Corynebacterium coyleae]|uniref:hypothetical protein n=1 Tax=Corynebacterium coyleae TaxID=53374 RepID=UPI00254EA3D7|nr:hypothetical protein [Corynebacterium coyleae]MDK8241698.1 hypothetical protein [Corynebacterium coyleae]
MSNKERAKRLLMPSIDWCDAHHQGEAGDLPCMYCEADAETGAERLAEAGLLAPDLPEPGVFKDGAEVEWATLDGYVNVENGLITVSHDERTEDDTPDKKAQLWPEPGQIKFLDHTAARHLGTLLIAAADHAERYQRE